MRREEERRREKKREEERRREKREKRREKKREEERRREKKREREKREEREEERGREEKIQRRREKEKRERERERRERERERRERERKREREKEREREREERERKREREKERERERKRERKRRPLQGQWSFPFCLESGCAAMECHGDRRPGRYINTGLEQKTPRSVSWTLMVSPIDVFPRQAVESDALLSPSASREGWLHGEVGAFDSHEQGAREESDCSGSRVKRVLTRSEDKVDKAEKDTVTLNEEKGEVHLQRKDMTPNVTGVASGVRSVVAWRKTVTLNEEQGEVLTWRKDKRPNATWGGVWRAERRCLEKDSDTQ